MGIGAEVFVGSRVPRVRRVVPCSPPLSVAVRSPPCMSGGDEGEGYGVKHYRSLRVMSFNSTDEPEL